MTKFEAVGVQIQNGSESVFDCKRQFRNSCRICCMRNMRIECDRCAIKDAYDLNVSVLAELERKRAEGVRIRINLASAI